MSPACMTVMGEAGRWDGPSGSQSKGVCLSAQGLDPLTRPVCEAGTGLAGGQQWPAHLAGARVAVGGSSWRCLGLKCGLVPLAEHERAVLGRHSRIHPSRASAQPGPPEPQCPGREDDTCCLQEPGVLCARTRPRSSPRRLPLQLETRLPHLQAGNTGVMAIPTPPRELCSQGPGRRAGAHSTPRTGPALPLSPWGLVAPSIQLDWEEGRSVCTAGVRRAPVPRSRVFSLLLSCVSLEERSCPGTVASSSRPALGTWGAQWHEEGPRRPVWERPRQTLSSLVHFPGPRPALPPPPPSAEQVPPRSGPGCSCSDTDCGASPIS